MGYKPTPIMFIDLDGTIIKGKEDLGHWCRGPQDVELYDGVFDKLRDWKSKGNRLVLISNQGGIALGHIADNTVSRIMAEVSRLCGNLFDRMMWCPHHPDAIVLMADGSDERDPEKTIEASECFCRKPRPGLLFAAMMALQEQYPTEYYRPSASIFVGDMACDQDCAESLGIPFIGAKKWREGV